MNLVPGRPLLGQPIDVVFIGSCTNGRIEDLRLAASVMTGRRVANRVRALVVPGSQAVKRQAEAEGLDQVFLAAGAEWREPGCSMCIAMNGDEIAAGQYAVSTSNRNFEGRQGKGGRTILREPAHCRRGGGDRERHRCPGARAMKRVRGPFVYLDVQNVDTDRIIPARFLKATTKRGLASALFADWAEGAAARRAISDGASVLVAAENFGCGSSREHAVWALADAGIRAVLSPRLADIFRSNASKNGIVPVVIDDSMYASLRSFLEAEIEVDSSTR